MADLTIRPYIIDAAEEELDDLCRRLAATRWPDAVKQAISEAKLA